MCWSKNKHIVELVQIANIDFHFLLLKVQIIFSGEQSKGKYIKVYKIIIYFSYVYDFFIIIIIFCNEFKLNEK